MGDGPLEIAILRMIGEELSAIFDNLLFGLSSAGVSPTPGFAPRTGPGDFPLTPLDSRVLSRKSFVFKNPGRGSDGQSSSVVASKSQ